MNSRLPVERHIHTNYTPLAAIDNHGFLPNVLMVLKRQSVTLQIPNTIKSHILCLCIIVSKTYSFNSTTSPQYNDAMIYSCWQRIERSIKYLELTHAIDAHLFKQLLMGRSSDAYKSIADARDSDSVVCMTKIPKMILLERDRILDLTHGLKVETTIIYKSLMTRFTSLRVYRSIYQCVTSDSNIGDVWTLFITPKESNDTKVPFMYPDCLCVGYMSPECGMESQCNILMRTGDSWTELYDEESVDPLLYIDNSGCLDPLVESEFCTLLGYYGYKTPLYIRSMVPACDSVVGTEELVIQQSRQCISIGSVQSVTELIRVWMVRPTINYSSYIITATVATRDSVACICANRLRSLANYNSVELAIKCPVDKPDIIEISGTMSHYYMPKVGIESRMKHVSLGGSVIRVHQVKDFNTSPKVVDICMNMGILTSLVSGMRLGLDIEITPKCIRLKYHTGTSFGLGPSLMIGCNGDFQWLGNPIHIVDSLSAMFAFMNKNIKTSQFVDAISKSTIIQRYVYPMGIPRHKQSSRLQITREHTPLV